MKYVQNLIGGVIYAQVILAVAGQKYAPELGVMFLAVQLNTFMNIYKVAFPPITQDYILAFREIITLKDITPSKLGERLGLDWDLMKWWGLKWKEEDKKKDTFSLGSSNIIKNMFGFIFAFVMGGFIMGTFAMVSVFCCQLCGGWWVEKLRGIFEKMYFEKPIKAQTMTYLQSSIVLAVNLVSGSNKDWVQTTASVASILLVYFYPIGVTSFMLFFDAETLSGPIFKKMFGAFYPGVKINKGTWAKLYYPITIIRRLAFTHMPILFYEYPCFQVQALIVIQFSFTWYYIGTLPHLGGMIKAL